MGRAWPIIEYARKIKKNTADLTTMDLVRFTNEWIKQPIREDIVKMAKKYVDAQKSRLTPDQVVEVEAEMNGEVLADEIVCSMDLTRADVEALLFSINCTCQDYVMDKSSPYTGSLMQLKEGLEGV